MYITKSMLIGGNSSLFYHNLLVVKQKSSDTGYANGIISFGLNTATSTSVYTNIFYTCIPELSDKYYKYVIELFGLKSENEVDSALIANISIKESKHRFGKIKEGETVSTKFEIKNVSEIPFVIHKVETTCGCTVAEWDKNSIEKNRTASITVNFKADKIGFFTKKIFVFSNTKNSPQILLISGNVVREK